MILPRTRRERLNRVWRRLRGAPVCPDPRPADRLFPPWLLAFLAVAVIGSAFIVFDPIVLALREDWPAPVRSVFRVLTELGNSGAWLWPSGLLALAISIYGIARSRRLDAMLTTLSLRLGFFFAAIAVSGLSVTIAKRLIGRVRPAHVDERFQYHFEPFGWSAKAASFPSGHATTAFAVAAALLLLIGGRFRPAMIVLACLVALSRVVLDAHFMSDIIAGAVYGSLVTILIARYLARRRLVFEPRPTGGLALRGHVAPKTLLKLWRKETITRDGQAGQART